MAEQLFFSRDTNVFLGVSTIKAVQVTAAGSSYETAPTVAFSADAGGTGAAATATVRVSYRSCERARVCVRVFVSTVCGCKL